MCNVIGADGSGYLFSEMQISSQTCVDRSIIGKRLDVCVSYCLDKGGNELRWSQGGVILISNYSNIMKPFC